MDFLWISFPLSLKQIERLFDILYWKYAYAAYDYNFKLKIERICDNLGIYSIIFSH